MPKKTKGAKANGHKASSKSSSVKSKTWRDFWLEIGPEERKSLCELDVPNVIRNLRTQHRNLCSCPTCGRKSVSFDTEVQMFEDYCWQLERQGALHSICHSRPAAAQKLLESGSSSGGGGTSSSTTALEPVHQHTCAKHSKSCSGQNHALVLPSRRDFPFGDHLIIRNGKLTVTPEYLQNGQLFADLIALCEEIYQISDGPDWADARSKAFPSPSKDFADAVDRQRVISLHGSQPTPLHALPLFTNMPPSERQAAMIGEGITSLSKRLRRHRHHHHHHHQRSEQHQHQHQHQTNEEATSGEDGEELDEEEEEGEGEGNSSEGAECGSSVSGGDGLGHGHGHGEHGGSEDGSQYDSEFDEEEPEDEDGSHTGSDGDFYSTEEEEEGCEDSEGEGDGESDYEEHSGQSSQESQAHSPQSNENNIVTPKTDHSTSAPTPTSGSGPTESGALVPASAAFGGSGDRSETSDPDAKSRKRRTRHRIRVLKNQEARLFFQVYVLRCFAHNVLVRHRDLIALEHQRELLEEVEEEEKRKEQKMKKHEEARIKQKTEAQRKQMEDQKKREEEEKLKKMAEEEEKRRKKEAKEKAKQERESSPPPPPPISTAPQKPKNGSKKRKSETSLSQPPSAAQTLSISQADIIPAPPPAPIPPPSAVASTQSDQPKSGKSKKKSKEGQPAAEPPAVLSSGNAEQAINSAVPVDECADLLQTLTSSCSASIPVDTQSGKTNDLTTNNDELDISTLMSQLLVPPTVNPQPPPQAPQLPPSAAGWAAFGNLTAATNFSPMPPMVSAGAGPIGPPMYPSAPLPPPQPSSIPINGGWTTTSLGGPQQIPMGAMPNQKQASPLGLGGVDWGMGLGGGYGGISSGFQQHHQSPFSLPSISSFSLFGPTMLGVPEQEPTMIFPYANGVSTATHQPFGAFGSSSSRPFPSGSIFPQPPR